MQLIDVLALYKSDLILPLALGIPGFLFLFFLFFSIRKLRDYLKKVTQQQNGGRNILRAYLIVVSALTLFVSVILVFLAIFPWYTANFLAFIVFLLYLTTYVSFTKNSFPISWRKSSILVP